MRASLLRAFGLIAAAAAAISPAYAHSGCADAGQWVAPGSGRIPAREVLSSAAEQSVVLLGESHDSADDHRWQLQTIAALAALRGKVVLGFEMFPRRVQPALDRWVAGELGEKEFLAAADWDRVWGYEAPLYMPLFHFARLNRIPMIALNVEHSFPQAVGARGFDAVPPEKREGVSAAAPASEAYMKRLFSIYRKHPDKGKSPTRSDPAFLRFVQSQLVWDRAFAQAIAERIRRDPAALVIAIMGSGHIMHGDGVPHQLESLGVTDVASLLPWEANTECHEFSPGLATAVFGVPAALPRPPRQLLGIRIQTVADGVRVVSVGFDSLAKAAGLRVGDVIVEAAGGPVKGTGDVRSAVESVAPGTWLPLRVKRKGETVDLVAKFPREKNPAAK